MTQTTPTPGQPLSEADVSLLQPGDWLLQHCQGGAVQAVQFFADEQAGYLAITAPWLSRPSVARAKDFTFLGRPDQDGPSEARIRALEHRLETARFARVEHNRQFEAEREARLAAEAKLGSLLARIHRDGGHRQAETGTEKACEEAEVIIARALQQEGE